MLEAAQGRFHRDKEEALKQQILSALQEFDDLEDGAFYFSQERELHVPELGSAKLSDISLEHGITVNQIVLTLAHQRDEEHHASQSLEFLGSEQPTRDPSSHLVFKKAERESVARFPRPSTTVLLVDDEKPVREIVGAELRKEGHEVRTASGPAEAVAIAMELVRFESEHIIVVADLGMPTTSGQSYLGGLELVQNLAERAIDLPVFLSTEELSESSRDEAMRLGVRKVVFKPSLSKLHTEQYQADLRSFAFLLINLLKETELRVSKSRDRAIDERAANEPLARHFLTSMGEQLTDPERSFRISNHVLPVVTCLASTDDKEIKLPEEGAPSVLIDNSSARKHERIESKISTTFSCRKEMGEGFLSDLSEKGAFLNTGKLFPVGEIIRLRISLPHKMGEVTAEARIVWLNYRSHDLDAAPHGMGLAFIGPFS